PILNISFLPVERWVQTPKGEGLWLAIIDYGPSHNPVYLIELNDSGDHICVDMCEVRGTENMMYGLSRPTPPRRKMEE
ncbi:MAG: hypothetical protein EBV23_10005, partial [Flavobacteriia bacterium]|nr:hypothetical protein [Flavobacteriia bacterium]